MKSFVLYILVTGKSIYETLIVVESDLISDTKLLAFGFPLLTVEFSDIYIIESLSFFLLFVLKFQSCKGALLYWPKLYISGSFEPGICEVIQ